MISACLLKEKSADLKRVSVGWSAVSQPQPCVKSLLWLALSHHDKLLLLSHVCQTPNCSYTFRSNTTSVRNIAIFSLKQKHLFQMLWLLSGRFGGSHFIIFPPWWTIAVKALIYSCSIAVGLSCLPEKKVNYTWRKTTWPKASV